MRLECGLCGQALRLNSTESLVVEVDPKKVPGINGTYTPEASMNRVPVLLLGFNRPKKTAQLIRALSDTKPDLTIFNVDGPRPNYPDDEKAVASVRECTELITWKCTVENRFNDANLGLRRAVVDAVTYSIEHYGSVIVLEDDIIPGPHLVPYMHKMLFDLKNRNDVGHISGYNLVPPDVLRMPSEHSRLSLYPESYAWATWARAWEKYDDTLSWGIDCSISELARVTGGLRSALRWRINFQDAALGRIDSWAYRWIASLWKNGLYSASPNINLCSYDGFDAGTHTFRKPRWQDLPIGEPTALDGQWNSSQVDSSADSWIGRTVFRETLPGLVDGMASSVALEILRRRRLRRTG